MTDAREENITGPRTPCVGGPVIIVSYCLAVKDSGAVEEASQRSCSAATQHLGQGSLWQNCMLIVIFRLFFVFI